MASSSRTTQVGADKVQVQADNSVLNGVGQQISLISFEMICNSPLSDASSGYESCATNYSSPDRYPPLTEVGPCSVSSMEPEPVRASADHAIQTDLRVVKQLLTIEERYMARNVLHSVYESSNWPVDRKARSIVVNWMLEVCEEFKCEDAVFPLAVNMLDRFIESTPDIRKGRLQLLSVVCLSLASKVRDCSALALNDLSHMTEYSVRVNEIQNWEPLVLNSLGWDISAIIPNDYLDSILYNLNTLSCFTRSPTATTTTTKTALSNSTNDSTFTTNLSRKRTLHSADDDFKLSSKRSKQDTATTTRKTPSTTPTILTTNLLETIRRHSVTLISLCACELDFVPVRPSIIAAACVVSAMRGIIREPRDTIASFCEELEFDIDSNLIENTVTKIEELFANQLQATSSTLSTSGSENASARAITSSSALSAPSTPTSSCLAATGTASSLPNVSSSSQNVPSQPTQSVPLSHSCQNRQLQPNQRSVQHSDNRHAPKNATAAGASALVGPRSYDTDSNNFGKMKQFLLNTTNTANPTLPPLNQSQSLLSFRPQLLNSSVYQDDENRENIPVHLSNHNAMLQSNNQQFDNSPDDNDELDDTENSYR